MHGVEFTAVVNRGALDERPVDPVLVRLVRHHRNPPHAFGTQLVRDPLRGQRAVVRLAARHRHRIVVEHLVRDARAGRDGGSDRQKSRVLIRPVAQVLEDVRLLDELLHADPVGALRTHVRGEVRVAIGPHRHVVAADARHGHRAVGNLG